MRLTVVHSTTYEPKAHWTCVLEAMSTWDVCYSCANSSMLCRFWKRLCEKQDVGRWKMCNFLKHFFSASWGPKKHPQQLCYCAERRTVTSTRISAKSSYWLFYITIRHHHWVLPSPPSSVPPPPPPSSPWLTSPCSSTPSSPCPPS